MNKTVETQNYNNEEFVGLFENIEDDYDYYNLCCEIYITKNRFLKFHCSQCDNITTNYRDLVSHLIEVHYNKKIYEETQWEEENEDSCNEMEVSCNEKEENFKLIENTTNYKLNELNIELLSGDDTSYNQNNNLEIKNQTDSSVSISDESYNCNSPIISYKKIGEMFECDLCGLLFKNKCNLKLHRRRHTGQKEFACKQCTKKFYTRSELTIHERRHSGLRPFMCTICGSAYPSCGALTTHMKRHSDDRPFKCKICEKTFVHSYDLKNHLLVHNPDQRDFVCDICHMTFQRRYTLRVHMKIHENKREYKCKICEADFNQKSALFLHIKNKHRVVDYKDVPNDTHK